MGLIAYIIFALLGIFAVEPFYLSQTKDAASPITQYGIEYLSWVMICSFGMYAQVLLERLLISTGRTFYSMITQTIGAVTNIILDPILIFGMLGMPEMGGKGAAIATVTGQCVAAVIALIFNITKNHDIKIRVKGFIPDRRIIGTI